MVRYEVKVGAYNPTKNVVELEGLDDTFATTVSHSVNSVIIFHIIS